jgi:hypothetical protein
MWHSCKKGRVGVAQALAGRLFAGACACAVVLASAGDARAWYFPEHVALEHDGVMQLPPELREILKGAVARARDEGMNLCARVDVPLDEVAQRKTVDTRMVHSEIGVDCVPYSVLPALAGDHAGSAAELRTVLTTKKGIEITSVVAYEWSRFEAALTRLPNWSLERMSFVHALDVALYFVDPGYELRAQATHAHFGDGGRRIEEVLTRAEAGTIDNSLAQFLAHHLRSLGLAARGSVSEAVLEHAFAMHFLQDAFAAGHLVLTEVEWTHGNARARRRHDFFDAKGLAVGRAMSAEPCPALGAGSLELSGLRPCWVTTGDGYLGTSPDTSERLHAARAVTKAEVQFAIALDPEHALAAMAALGEREQIALGQLVEPVPWWTVSAVQRRQLRASASRSLRLVRAAARALETLGASAPMDAVDVDTPRRPGLFDPTAMAESMAPCKPRGQVDPAFVEDGDTVPCGPSQALALGGVGVSLLRPMLVEWPTSQVPPSALQGESKEDLGWAIQLMAGANATVLFPPRAPVDFLAPSIGAAAGLSYRWGTYLPGRVNRSLFELNLGVSEALQYDSHGHAGGNAFVTFADEELRWPLLWELLTSYTLPLDLAKGHEAGGLLFLSGLRVHEVVASPAPAFWGVELEAVALALSPGRGAYPLYAVSPELRLYVGLANPHAAQSSFPAAWGPTLGIELTGGYATFL